MISPRTAPVGPASGPGTGYRSLSSSSRAAHDLLVHLGELAADGGAASGRQRRQHGEAARQPMAGVEGDDEAAAAAPARASVVSSSRARRGR